MNVLIIMLLLLPPLTDFSEHKLVIHDHVDIIELNHYQSEIDNFKTFDQIILWKKYSRQPTIEDRHKLEDPYYHHHTDGFIYHAIVWIRIPKNYRRDYTVRELFSLREQWVKDCPGQTFPSFGKKWLGGPMVPKKNWTTNQYYFVWFDEQSNILRKIVSKQYRETTTLYDPERADAAHWPKMMRATLTPIEIPNQK